MKRPNKTTATIVFESSLLMLDNNKKLIIAARAVKYSENVLGTSVTADELERMSKMMIEEVHPNTCLLLKRCILRSEIADTNMRMAARHAKRILAEISEGMSVDWNSIDRRYQAFDANEKW